MIGIVLVPIEEGRDPSWATRHVAYLHASGHVRVHLLNVRTPLPLYVARFLSRRDLDAFYEESGREALRPAGELLDAKGIAHTDHVRVGHKAETIVQFARELGCNHIVVSAASRRLLPDLGLGSIASQLRNLIGSSGCQISEVR